MARDVRRFIQGCSDCAISKSPCHLPSGKLLPLPVPTRPWSHLGVDFITDLPPSNSNTCILVIVDRFSKSCRLLPLKGLPTAIETAENLFNQVFRQPRGHIIRPRTPIHFPRLEGLLPPECDRKSLLWLPSTDQRADGEESTGDRPILTNLLPPELLEAGPSTHRTPFANHPPDSLLSSACSGTSPLFSPGQANHPTFHRSTTGSERARGSGTQLTTNYNELYADAK